MALPFDLPAVSRGFAELTAGARAAGRDAAAAAARGLGTLLGREVMVTGAALAGVPPPRIPTARLGLELAALPAAAVLEVEPALVVRLVDVLAGGPGAPVGATALTPVEAAALELFALAALDGAASVAAIEATLAPRLARAASDVAGALAIELTVVAGDVAGRARLLVPPAAVRAVRGPGSADGAAAALRIPLSLRRGTVALAAEELELLSPGDVVVVDADPLADGAATLVLPGGAAIRGRREADSFQVEEAAMTERTAQLPVTLEVELARIEIPLGELARLEPGTVLPLPVDRRGLVTLRAGGRAVARGELVDVDGAVGVRVLSVEVTP
ncbi:MAG TPA: type III secretion system cytoplasmic ring protein SctQ [Anaeromyxobacter sp.]|nr:type III secretion system cytoplasmic ring protein SctQ [Anaeromyxobacter sp.]